MAFLVATGWPAPVGLLLLPALGLARDAFGGFALPLLGVTALSLCLFALWWLPARAWGWLFQRYILTNERVIASTGWFWRRREIIELRHIAQVRVDRRNPILVALGVGDVEVRTAGAPLLLADVARPHEIADAILAAMGSHAKRRAKAAPTVSIPRVQAVLDELARPEALPPVPPVRRSAPPGLGRRTIPVRLLAGEALLEVVYRHWFILLRQLALAAILWVAGIVLGSALAAGGGEGWALLVMIGGMCGSAIAGFLTYLNWADDMFVLTTHRVIDIDRVLFVLAESSDDAAYGKVQNVRVRQGLLGKLLGFGSILVETAGRKHPLEMKDIPRAFDVMNRIFAQIDRAREREQVTLANERKQEIRLWLSAVLGQLLVTVPDLRGLPLVDAIVATHGAGLRLVVAGERTLPSGPPGEVLEQTPYPGTCALGDGEVHVLLSGGSITGGRFAGGQSAG